MLVACDLKHIKDSLKEFIAQLKRLDNNSSLYIKLETINQALSNIAR